MKYVAIFIFTLSLFSCSSVKKIEQHRKVSSESGDLANCYSAFLMLSERSSSRPFSSNMKQMVVSRSQDDLTVTYRKSSQNDDLLMDDGNLNIWKLEQSVSKNHILEIEVTRPLKNKPWSQREILPKQSGNERFYIQTANTSNDGEYRTFIDNAISMKYQPSHHEEVKIVINGALWDQMAMSQSIVRTQHERVIEFYKFKKGDYLQTEDYKQLLTLDDNYNNQFTVSLTKRPLQNDIDEYHDSLKATITLVLPNKDVYGPSFSFFNRPQKVRIPLMDRMYYIPPKQKLDQFDEYFLRGDKNLVSDDVIVRARENINKEIEKYRPQEGEIPNAFSLAKYIYDKFGNDKRFAELVRYSHFEHVTPQERNILLYEAFKKARESNVDYVLASTDRDTRALFKRKYQMKELGSFYSRKFHDIGNEEELMEEYILYLDVNSEHFDEILTNLKKEI